MQPPPDPHQRGVSTREAAMLLGTSQSDVLRRIRAGELRAERFERRGGTYFRVYLDSPQPPPAEAAVSETEAAPEPRQDASALAERLLDRLDERDATIAGLHAELRAETAARAAAEARLTESSQAHTRQREADAETIRELRAEVERLRVLAERPWWRRSWW